MDAGNEQSGPSWMNLGTSRMASRMKSSGHRMWRVHARASKPGINVRGCSNPYSADTGNKAVWYLGGKIIVQVFGWRE